MNRDLVLYTCRKCGEEKSQEEMYATKCRGKIYYRRCKGCESLREAEYYQRHAEQIKAAHMKYHNDNRDTLNARRREIARANGIKPEDKARYKKYAESNRDKMLAASKKYVRTHPDKRKASTTKYAVINSCKIRAAKKAKYLNLGDQIVKQIIKDQLGCTNTEITPEIITLKREQLLLHRQIKELKNGITRTGNQGTEGNEQETGGGDNLQ